jgi:predicted ribosomally synthesized peptide with nif11-like leader
MSVYSAKAFIAMVKENETLRDDLRTAASSENLHEPLKLAATVGYTFSMDEFVSALLNEWTDEPEELYELELDGVTGGNNVNTMSANGGCATLGRNNECRVTIA